MVSERFPNWPLKCSFHIYILLSKQVLALISRCSCLLFTSFTVYYANCDCLSSIKFLILFIWPWMYSNCSFWYVLVLSGLSYVSAFCGFLLLSRDFSTISVFFLTVIDSHGTLHLTLGLVSMYSAACFNMGCNKVFIFVIRKMSFRCFLKSIKFLSNNYRITNIYIYKWGPVEACGLNCLFLISA